MLKGPQRKSKIQSNTYKMPEEKKAYTSSRQIPLQQRAQQQPSKFSKRFNMTGSGMTSISQVLQEERTDTPSTQTSDHQTPEKQSHQDDLNQWIKMPSGLGLLG